MNLFIRLALRFAFLPVLLGACFGVRQVIAQNSNLGSIEYLTEKKLQIGATIGYSLSGLLISDGGWPDTRGALVLGTSARLKPFNWISLESGLHYQGRGGYILTSISSSGSLVGYKIKMGTITVPLLLNFHRFLGNDDRYPIFGPYVSYTFAGSSSSSNEVSFGKDPGEFRRGELGAILGYGIDIETKKFALKFDVLFHVGIRDIYSSSSTNLFAHSFGLTGRTSFFSKVGLKKGSPPHKPS
ncbi:MAG: outer membrane beta-barrel protein [Bacteroidia bacterium]|nr:outer membrane beta-barrel protein [Bacteroidia bacterium]